MKICFICNGPATDRHHIFNGGLRKHSEEDALVITVCRECHDKIHSTRELSDLVKAYGQLWYENDHSHWRYMERYKKNYVDEGEDIRSVYKKIRREYGGKKNVL